MAIRETIANFIARASDVVLSGRNASRIVLGTDRKRERDTGFGDESRSGTTNSAVIDLVAGFSAPNPEYTSDKTRIYLAQKTNPDEYFEIELGENQTETAAAVIISDQIYLKARQNIKIRNGEVTILITANGNINIEASGDTQIKSGASVINMTSGGDINIGAENGVQKRILTEDSLAVAIDPTTGAPQICRFVDTIGVDAVLGGFVGNNKVKIVT